MLNGIQEFSEETQNKWVGQEDQKSLTEREDILSAWSAVSYLNNNVLSHVYLVVNSF